MVTSPNYLQTIDSIVSQHVCNVKYKYAVIGDDSE